MAELRGSPTPERRVAHGVGNKAVLLPAARAPREDFVGRVRKESKIMPNAAAETDVLIVGAGPVGLFLANECARRGLRWRLVEARATQSRHSKALAIFPRTLEIFDMAGVAVPFLEAANRVTSIAVVTPRRTLARMHFAPDNSPYPFIAMVPQDQTERLLVEQLSRRGGAVEYETSFVTAVQQDDSVTVTLDRDGTRTEMSAAFVVGCDGAHSPVRHLLDLPFDGAEYHDEFLLADVETNDVLAADELQLCPSSLGPLAIFPMSATRRRIVAMIRRPEGDAPSLDLVRRMLAERAPAVIEARSLHWSSYFRIHHRHVSKLREGRIFVAGDAAHIHSPFGGQGMNTGLQDVWNLAWKLDLFLRGRGNERLLDSYGLERLPVIRNVIATTDFLTRTMGTPNKIAEVLRDTMIPMISRLAPFQHAFVQRLSELGIAYHGSPIVEGKGQRYMDDSIRGGHGILDRFLLVLEEGANPDIVEAARQLERSMADVLELRRTPRSGATLVRPDGYIGLSAKRADRDALMEVQQLLERQTAVGTLDPVGAF
ncbi:MAG TPA: FAD-dependent monooxygenase [Rhodanobacteraceae bacterium]|nr:FAD-dependent monooxygenase [Rhodanobacteraceae bacterium]